MTARPHRIERIDAGAGTQTMPLVETDTLTKQFEPRVPRRRPWEFLRWFCQISENASFASVALISKPARICP